MVALNANYDEQSVAKFWARVEPELNTGCWLWAGAVSNGGYGNVYLCGQHDRAHRLSWKFTNGEIPGGFRICHRCDTPTCVNPAHLFLGTAADNTQDMRSKGRGRGGSQKGEANKRARLSPADVIAIRARAAAGENYTRIAADYGLTRTTITYAALGKTWSHIPGFHEKKAVV